MVTPILDLKHQVWYTGYTGTNCFLEGYTNVLLSYNLDTLCSTIHPLEKDAIGFKTSTLLIPYPLRAPFVFTLPVVNEGYFFKRESFINPQNTLRRARCVQMLGYNTFNSKKMRKLKCHP